MFEPHRLLSDPIALIAAGAAIIFQMIDSTFITWRAALVVVFGGIFSAAVFAPAIVDFFGVHFRSVEYAIVALTTLTGPFVLMVAIGIVKDPSKGIDLWRQIRGKQ